MGFSISGATIIVFAGLLLSASVAYPVMDNAAEQYQEAQQFQTDRQVQIQNTAITIQNTSYNNTTDTLNISIENTGSNTLSVNATDLLIDGQYQTGYKTTVAGASDRTFWVSGGVMNITVTGVTTKPGRVKVVTEHEIADITQV